MGEVAVALCFPQPPPFPEHGEGSPQWPILAVPCSLYSGFHSNLRSCRKYQPVCRMRYPTLESASAQLSKSSLIKKDEVFGMDI